MKPKRLQWQADSPTYEKANGYFIVDTNDGTPVRLYYPWDHQGNYADEFNTREEAKAASQQHYDNNVREFVRQNFDFSDEKEIADRGILPADSDVYSMVGGNVDDAYSLGFNDGETFATRRLLSNLCCINEPKNSNE